MWYCLESALYTFPYLHIRTGCEIVWVEGSQVTAGLPVCKRIWETIISLVFSFTLSLSVLYTSKSTCCGVSSTQNFDWHWAAQATIQSRGRHSHSASILGTWMKGRSELFSKAIRMNNSATAVHFSMQPFRTVQVGLKYLLTDITAFLCLLVVVDSTHLTHSSDLKWLYDVAKKNIILCIRCNAMFMWFKFKKTHYCTFPHTVHCCCSSMLRLSETYIFTKLIPVSSDWPAIQCLVIGRIPQACDGNVMPLTVMWCCVLAWWDENNKTHYKRAILLHPVGT